jgi:separase
MLIRLDPSSSNHPPNSPSFQSLPCPSSGTELSSTQLSLIAQYLTYAIVATCGRVATKSSLSSLPSLLSLANSLTSSPTILAWIPFLSPLPVKTTDSLLTRVYKALNALATEISPSSIPETDAIFQIRHYGLKCLVTASPDVLNKPESFWDQAVRSAASYARHVSHFPDSSDEDLGRMAEVVAILFEELVSLFEQRPDSAVFFTGKGFLTFCENGVDFAKKVTLDAALEIYFVYPSVF